MSFPKDSAFAQEEKNQLAWEKRLANKVLPTAPATTDDRLQERNAAVLDTDGLYDLLDRALSHLERDDVQAALPLVEEARNTLYTQMR